MGVAREVEEKVYRRGAYLCELEEPRAGGWAEHCGWIGLVTGDEVGLVVAANFSGARTMVQLRRRVYVFPRLGTRSEMWRRAIP